MRFAVSVLIGVICVGMAGMLWKPSWKRDHPTRWAILCFVGGEAVGIPLSLAFWLWN